LTIIVLLGSLLYIEIMELRIYTNDFVIISFNSHSDYFDKYTAQCVNVKLNKCYFIRNYLENNNYAAYEVIKWMFILLYFR
jgi:hypothetical protein